MDDLLKNPIIKTAAIAGMTLAVIGGGTLVLLPDEKIKLDNPQVVEWEKPTTDAEWAEDVKKENFDIKSTAVLEEMVLLHKEKLERFINGSRETLECEECIKYEIESTYPELNESEFEDIYRIRVAEIRGEIEKLQQSIERMEKELELRRKGFVQVEGEPKGFLEGDVPENRVRYTKD